MLTQLRNKKVQKGIYIFLAVMIIPSFVMFGVMFTGEKDKNQNPSTALATLNGRTISVKDYLDSYKACRNEMALIFGANLGKIQHLINFKEKAWQRILLLDYAKKQGIRPTDHEVVDFIASMGTFQNRGSFDPALYKAVIGNGLKMDERGFEEEMRGSLAIEKINDNIQKEIHLNDAEVKKLFDKKNKKNAKAKYAEQKDNFKKSLLQKKSNIRINALLGTLRGNLHINQELAKNIFDN